MKNIHIGDEIRKKVYERGMTITEFAKRIHRSREAVYSIFERPSINTDLLKTISLVLEYDFFMLYSDEKSACCPQKGNSFFQF